MTSHQRFDAMFEESETFDFPPFSFSHLKALADRDSAFAEIQPYFVDCMYAGWQAAERDMLERAIELIQSQPDGSYRAELITAGMIRKLKELLNEQH